MSDSKQSTGNQAAASQQAKGGKIDHERLENVALKIFAASMAVGVHSTQMNHAVERSFQGAETFLRVSNAIQEGRSVRDDQETSPLLPYHCPVLPKSHPLNIAARRHVRRDKSEAGGDAKLVKRIYERIKGIDTDRIENRKEGEIVFEDTDVGVAWDYQTLQIAKHVFPDIAAAVN